MATQLSAAELTANMQPQVYAAVVSTRFLAYIAIGLRFWARYVGGTRVWWDDWIIGATLLVLIPEFAVEIVNVTLGAGRHLEFVLATEPGSVPIFAKMTYADTLLYPLVVTPVKCSVLCLYIRLFGIRKRFTLLCQTLIGISIAWGLATFLIFAFQCSPISHAWGATREGCLNFDTIYIATNVPNIIIDFIILATPLYPIWQLRIPTTKKLMINAILALGAVEVAFSIIRVVKCATITFEDATWDTATALIWSAVEANIGVVCCCIPVIGPLLPHFIQRKMRSSSKTSPETGKTLITSTVEISVQLHRAQPSRDASRSISSEDPNFRKPPTAFSSNV